MKRSLLPFLLLALLLTSCSKTKTYPVQDNLKAYFNFKEGSYWICKDTATGIDDSIAVINYDDEYPPDGDAILRFDKTEHEYINISIKVFSIADTSYMTISIPQSANNCVLSFATTSYPDFTPFSLNSSEPGVQKEILPSVEVNGKTHSNVYLYRKQVDSTRTDEIMMNADAGFIKISRGAGNERKVLELQRSNIIR